MESFLTLAFGGTGFRGFAVIRTDLAELALCRRFEVTRFTSCVREWRQGPCKIIISGVSVKQRQEKYVTDQKSFHSFCQEGRVVTNF